MSKVLVILAIACGGLGLLSLHLVSRLRDGEATIAELKTQLATLQAGQRQQAAVTDTFGSSSPQRTITQVIDPASSPAPPVPQTLPKAAPPQANISTLARPSREEGMRMMREHRERQRQLMQDPEYRDAVRLQARTNLARQYPGVIEELALGQADAEAFFNMLADQQMRANEQMEPLWEVESMDNSDPAAIQQRHSRIQQAALEMQRTNEAELSARFGPQKLQAWQEYQSTMGQRWQLEQMRSTLAAQGLPLNEGVSKPMLKAMSEAMKVEMQEYAVTTRGSTGLVGKLSEGVTFETRTLEQSIESTKKRNQRMLDAVSSYLTFEQRQALERDQEAQVKMQEAQLRLARARGNGNSQGGFYMEGSGLTNVQPLQ